MKLSTFNITFCCRESKQDRTGKSYIEMGLNLCGERKYINLPRKEKPSDFKKAIASTKNNEIKRFCHLMEDSVKTAVNDILENGEPLTLENIKIYLQTGGVKSYTLENMFDDYLSLRRKHQANGEITSGALRKYELTKELFFKHSKLKPEDEVNRLSHAIVEDFYAELKGKYESASSASYMRKLKTIVDYSKSNNKIALNPFSNIRVTVAKKEIDYLTDAEINRLMALRKNPILTESLKNVLDCFLLQVFTGLAFTDLESLESKDIQEVQGLGYAIEKNRKKSGVRFFAIVLPEAEAIMREHGMIGSAQSTLRKISNQKMNVYLHQIENILRQQGGWTKNLHTHLGRHSYAFALLNKYKLRAETVARAMGHTTSKTTLKFYAEITNDTMVDEMRIALKKA